MINPAQFAVKFLCVTTLFLSIPALVPAQSSGTGGNTPQPSPVRDPQALATIQGALNAMGGASAVAAIQDSTVQGTMTYDSNSNMPPASFIWQTSGVEFQHTVQNSNGTYTSLSGHGKAAQLMNGNWAHLPPYNSRAELQFHIPALALYAETQNANYTFLFMGSSTISGNAAIHVHTVDNSDAIGSLVTPQEWYFDPSTYLPIRVEFKIPSQRNPHDSFPASMNFSNYQVVSGLAVPYQVRVQVWQVSKTATVSSVTFNSGLSASTFDPPAGSLQ